jgi:hypothetical protein
MTVHLTFDDLEPGTVVTTQYERSKGVVFTTPCAIIQDPETFAHSLQSQHLSSVTEAPTRVIRARFASPKHSRLAVTVCYSLASSCGVHALLRVFNANGEKLTERTFGSPGSTATVEFVSPDANISGFEISGRTNRFDCLDSLAFDAPPLADFRLVYDGLGDPLRMHAEEGESVAARISVFRLRGSHGEILLAMAKPCPGTSWQFDPPTIHSGVAHVDVVVRATDTTPPCRHCDMEIVAVPRGRAAGSHERVVTVPMSILAPRSDYVNDSWVAEEENEEERENEELARSDIMRG